MEFEVVDLCDSQEGGSSDDASAAAVNRPPSRKRNRRTPRPHPPRHDAVDLTTDESPQLQNRRQHQHSRTHGDAQASSSSNRGSSSSSSAGASSSYSNTNNHNTIDATRAASDSSDVEGNDVDAGPSHSSPFLRYVGHLMSSSLNSYLTNAAATSASTSHSAASGAPSLPWALPNFALPFPSSSGHGSLPPAAYAQAAQAFALLRRNGAHNRGGAGNHLAHLALVDRDFTEADYETLLQLDEDMEPEKKRRALLANSKRVSQLPSRRIRRTESSECESCAICLDDFKPQQKVLTLPCKHIFHNGCISKWLKMNEDPSCPVCKAPAFGVDKDGDEQT